MNNTKKYIFPNLTILNINKRNNKLTNMTLMIISPDAGQRREGEHMLPVTKTS